MTISLLDRSWTIAARAGRETCGDVRRDRHRRRPERARRRQPCSPTPAGRSTSSRRRRRPGGAVRSARAIEPGFVNDHCSAFYPLAAASPAIRWLDARAVRPALAARPARARAPCGRRLLRRPLRATSTRPRRRSTHLRAATATRGARCTACGSACGPGGLDLLVNAPAAGRAAAADGGRAARLRADPDGAAGDAVGATIRRGALRRRRSRRLIAGQRAARRPDARDRDRRLLRLRPLRARSGRRLARAGGRRREAQRGARPPARASAAARSRAATASSACSCARNRAVGVRTAAGRETRGAPRGARRGRRAAALPPLLDARRRPGVACSPTSAASTGTGRPSSSTGRSTARSRGRRPRRDGRRCPRHRQRRRADRPVVAAPHGARSRAPVPGLRPVLDDRRVAPTAGEGDRVGVHARAAAGCAATRRD